MASPEMSAWQIRGKQKWRETNGVDLARDWDNFLKPIFWTKARSNLPQWQAAFKIKGLSVGGRFSGKNK